MHSALAMSFGGLSRAEYFRHFVFGLMLAALVFGIVPTTTIPNFLMIPFMIVNTLLYPYSRFVYERVVGFFFGDNIFIVNAVFLLVAKLLTMLLCWLYAILISPIGLLYIYFKSSKAAGEATGD